MKIKVINLLINLANGTFNSNVEIKIDEKTTYTLDYYLYVMCGEMQGTYKELNNFLNQDVEIVNLSEHIKTILEEEKKIPEKLENEHEFYSYAKYEENKNEIDKALYILKAINLAEEKIGNLNNSVNEIIDYLDYLKSKGE